MKNICLIFEYDGSGFHGFQKQPEKRTVQGEIEHVLERITGRYIKTTGAGRTDTCVSAEEMYINFHTDAAVPPERYKPALNSILTNEIRIKSSFEVPEHFHARYSALSRTYRYRILNTPVNSALKRNYVCHCPFPLDFSVMEKAWLNLKGEYDFSAFCKTGSDRKNMKCTIIDTGITKTGDEIHLFITADSFLRSMVRLLMGTMIQIGQQRIAPDQLMNMVMNPGDNYKKITAPPQGLCLVKVTYPEAAFYNKEKLI